MRGPPPQPTVLKLLKGNPGKRPLNEDEPQPDALTTFEPPASLSKAAADHWKIIAPLLASNRLLTELDTDALGMYCEAKAVWTDAQAKYSKAPIIKAPSGYPMISPYHSVASRAFDQMSKLLTEFGLTPSSRTRIGVSARGPESNPSWGDSKKEKASRILDKINR